MAPSSHLSPPHFSLSVESPRVNTAPSLLPSSPLSSPLLLSASAHLRPPSPPLSMVLIHSLSPSACLCAPHSQQLSAPTSIHSCDFSCLYLSTDLVSPPSYLPPFAAIPSNLHLSPISLLHLWLHFILLILVFSWRSACRYFRLSLF